jgi:hypothetical protein
VQKIEPLNKIKNQPEEVNEPLHLESLTASLEIKMRRLANKSAINQAMLDYQQWASKKPTIRSSLSHCLFFLEQVEIRSGNNRLKENKEISEFIIALPEVKEKIEEIKEERNDLSLIWKSIGSHYEIKLEFRDKDGRKPNKEVLQKPIRR